MVSPTQELTQQVCHKYGWSFTIEQQKNHDYNDTNQEKDGNRKEEQEQQDGGGGVWTCSVTVGMGQTLSFASTCSSDDVKQGRNAAAAVALQGLQPLIAQQEAKPIMELTQVFPQPIPIYDSAVVDNWNYFWTHKPSVVGIDTEGNQKSPPVLVQISTDEYTILEVPGKQQGISSHLQRLLQDDTIIKVFCDNFSHRDKASLGLAVVEKKTKKKINNSKSNDDDKEEEEEENRLHYCSGPIVDVEALASVLFGPVTVARGLSRIVTLCMPELNVQIHKPKHAIAGKTKGRFQNIGRFALIEQGKAPPLRSMHDLSREEQQYAALDAWCTLQCYQRMRPHLDVDNDKQGAAL